MNIKLLSLVFACIILISLASASLEIEQSTITNTVSPELSLPAKFNVTIKNTDISSKTIRIINYLDIIFNPSPNDMFIIPSKDSETIEVLVYPSKRTKIEHMGRFAFKYNIISDSESIEKVFILDIVPAKDLIEISTPESINPNNQSFDIMVTNKGNIELREVKLTSPSKFFSLNNIISLSPFETKKITLQINKSGILNLPAGLNEINFSININKEATFSVQKKVIILELPEIVTDVKTSSNLLFSEIKTIKKNTGNIKSSAVVFASKNKIASWFTSFNVEPTNVYSEGNLVFYTWNKELAPQESFTVIVRTNFALPLFILLIFFISSIFAFKLNQNKLIIKKRVIKVKTSTGRFASKVLIYVKAKADVHDITLIDRLPHISELYERFSINPDIIDQKSGKIEWFIDSLHNNEERVYSYILTSKVHFFGRFEFPQAKAIYRYKGKTRKTFSNRLFFLIPEPLS